MLESYGQEMAKKHGPNFDRRNMEVDASPVYLTGGGKAWKVRYAHRGSRLRRNCISGQRIRLLDQQRSLIEIRCRYHCTSSGGGAPSSGEGNTSWERANHACAMTEVYKLEIEQMRHFLQQFWVCGYTRILISVCYSFAAVVCSVDHCQY